MAVRVSLSFFRGLIIAAPIALLAWLVIGLIFVVGGSLALWVADLALLWSPPR